MELENRSLQGSDPAIHNIQVAQQHEHCLIWITLKNTVSIPPFHFLKFKITGLTTRKMQILTRQESSLILSVMWSAEVVELLDSSTDQQPRRLLMYWFACLWNAYNLAYKFIIFYLWLHQPQVPTTKQP